MSRIKQYFITGLLVWLPMGITVWVLLWLVGRNTGRGSDYDGEFPDDDEL